MIYHYIAFVELETEGYEEDITHLKDSQKDEENFLQRRRFGVNHISKLNNKDIEKLKEEILSNENTLPDDLINLVKSL